MKGKIKEKVKTVIAFLLNPRLLLCLLIGWMITNGWSYILFAVGMWLKIDWMLWLSGAYLAFLWLPISPEKLVTVAIAIFLLRILFPKDEKTLAVLREMYHKAKGFVQKKKKEHGEKKEEHEKK